MHGFTDRVVAAEGEGNVTDTATHQRMWQGLLDQPRCIDKGLTVPVVLFDTRRNREDVGIENDILRRHTGPLRHDLVATFADPDLAVDRVSLALLIEGHDYHRGPVAAHLLRV